MTASSTPILKQCLELYASEPGLDYANADSRSLYLKLISIIEAALHNENYNQPLLDLYQALFREYEQQIVNHDQQHNIVIVIPVADRPQHLHECLSSLLGLCQAFNYGGAVNSRFNKIHVLIADDSRADENIDRHKQIAREISNQGIDCDYFGPTEQLQMLDSMSMDDQQLLKSLIGEIDQANFSHKGASITRNLCYLRLKQLYPNDHRRLFFFVDSDQEFRVAVKAGDVTSNVFAINYFHYLDAVFSQTDTKVLTGKVVGDPPVSPAVMISRFLDDVIHFLQTISGLVPTEPCQFHGMSQSMNDDASYHDMADLFGFKPVQAAHDYNCSLTGEHANKDCLVKFSHDVNNFFDGEHTTRKTCYQYQDVFSSIKDARTVYTGNYVLSLDALDYFIPFASLKLRMAGPVLGRILKSELAGDFVSANLPMLHNRTVDKLGQSEFRAGVCHNAIQVDLQDEFERQYFGDVMLFAIEKLTESGFPGESVSNDIISNVVAQVENEIHQKYLDRQIELEAKLVLLKQVSMDVQQWWCSHSENNDCLSALEEFIRNVENNFLSGARMHHVIMSAEYRKQTCVKLISAIANYPQDRQHWQSILDGLP
ncbi:MAG: hypothetical protein OEZ38_04245 [Gammaproteobacteria bacterium]|nr:hypothetical protein [Gammaproteobacteria bacterium]